METNYDAILLVSFGGPEKLEDVVPFLANATAGKNVPLERIRKVAQHYELFDGVSPINGYCRTLISSLRTELSSAGCELPIYWGNRNWHPLLPDTVAQMANDGIKRALAFVTAAYSSYSSCRQYLENIESAQLFVQKSGKRAPEIHKIPPYYDHPGFIDSNAEHLTVALSKIPAGQHQAVQVLFTAHSIPTAMAANCRYEEQLLKACKLVADKAEVKNWKLVFQSRSGDPAQPWLVPDINDYIRELGNIHLDRAVVREKSTEGQDPRSSFSLTHSPTENRIPSLSKEFAQTTVTDIVVVPIGFICDHMEIVYSLDVESAQVARSNGFNFVLAATAGTNIKFVRMVCDLILERLAPNTMTGGIHTDTETCQQVCLENCCPSGADAINKRVDEPAVRKQPAAV